MDLKERDRAQGRRVMFCILSAAVNVVYSMCHLCPTACWYSVMLACVAKVTSSLDDC